MSMAEAALLFPPDQILQFIGGRRDTDGPPLERAFMERSESDFGAEHRRNAFHTAANGGSGNHKGVGDLPPVIVIAFSESGVTAATAGFE